ncbi:MAG: tyrosine--tRNA ligase, partial [Solobacterium sp.]|nr:tyrosine--tRNA ligase [Solobacterium sp.]
LRDYGKHFNVANMLKKDTIAKRLETGISFTEFSYTILQALDWLKLYQNYDCRIQFGGSDQWGNLVSGTDLIKAICGDEAKVYGITSPLITKADGSKFGKSEGGNIWLDPEKTSAYEFYQFWVNVGDAEICTLLRRLSMRDPEEILKLEESVKTEPEKRLAQKALAEELTEIVHGPEGLAKAQKITDTLFSGNIMDLSADELREGLKDARKCEVEDGVALIDAMIAAGAATSRRDARQLIEQGSVQLNGEKVAATDAVLNVADAVDHDFSILKKGKRNYFVLDFKK